MFSHECVLSLEGRGGCRTKAPRVHPRIEENSKEDVIFALLAEPLLSTMFGERIPRVQEFFATLFSTFDAPCIFLSW